MLLIMLLKRNVNSKMRRNKLTVLKYVIRYFVNNIRHKLNIWRVRIKFPSSTISPVHFSPPVSG